MDRKNYIKGLVSGGSAFTLWGLLPLYWRLVSDLSAYQIFAHRVVWSLLFVTIVMYFKGTLKPFFKLTKDKHNYKRTILPAVFISINWLVYIWGVNNGYVIEAALGYYMNPLVLTLFGRIFYQERLTLLQFAGIMLAIVGVTFKIVVYGKVPAIALVLAFSFAIYGLLKKKSNYDSLTGLGFETLIVGVPALVFMIYSEFNGLGISGNLSASFWVLIGLSGAITAIPLLLYAEGTKRLPLTVVGFLQYIAPTIGLFLGIFVFKEDFSPKEWIPFVFIWCGLACFTYSQLKLLKSRR